MKVRETAGWVIGLLAVATIAACAPVAGTGPDSSNRTDVTTLTWTDNQPAYQVKCDLPGGCGERINAVCKHGPYKTLKSENMPTPGTAREVQKPASVVFRCG